MIEFYRWIAEAARRNDSLLCVGSIPAQNGWGRATICTVSTGASSMQRGIWCARTSPISHSRVGGPEGLEALRRTVAYVHQTADVPVILDAKRGDIGSTAQAYARAAFVVWGADALTVNPYLGQDSVTPFTAFAGKGVFLLCHTSNPGATDLQTLPCPSRPLYEAVAEKAKEWGTGLVVGATYPEALARVRALAPQAWILLPGVGAQGGDLEAPWLPGCGRMGWASSSIPRGALSMPRIRARQRWT